MHKVSMYACMYVTSDGWSARSIVLEQFAHRRGKREVLHVVFEPPRPRKLMRVYKCMCMYLCILHAHKHTYMKCFAPNSLNFCSIKFSCISTLFKQHRQCIILCMHACLYLCMYAFVCMPAHIQQRKQNITYACMHDCVYAWLCVCVYLWIRTSNSASGASPSARSLCSCSHEFVTCARTRDPVCM